MYCDLAKLNTFEYNGTYPSYNNEALSNEMLYFYVKDNGSINGTRAFVTYDIYNPQLINQTTMDLSTSAGGKNDITRGRLLSCWYKSGTSDWQLGTYVVNTHPLYANCYLNC